MNVLITGGAGFIGSHLAAYCRGSAEVVVLDNFRSGSRGNLEGLGCRVIEGSVLDRGLVREAVRGMDRVFHLAALVSVAESVRKPLETVEINVHGLLHVLEACAEEGVGKLCFASSAAVYGENPGHPKVETMVPDPRSPYAVTKLDGEYFCGMFTRAGRLPCACLRFFNVFGPRQDPRGPYAAAVPQFIQRARAGEPLEIHGDGGQTRDFIHVRDIVGALAFAADREEVTGVFNAGYGGAFSILDLAREIVRLTGSSSPIRHGPARPGDIRHSTADPSKLLAAGWKPVHSVTSGLAEMLAAG